MYVSTIMCLENYFLEISGICFHNYVYENAMRDLEIESMYRAKTAGIILTPAALIST